MLCAGTEHHEVMPKHTIMQEADLLTQASTQTEADNAGDASHPLFIPGDTCWRCVPADRVAFLVDAAAYFSAFKAAALRARRSIVIIGWDIDSRVRLEPDRDDVPAPDRLGDFLDHLLVNRPGLHVHILAWDFPLIYAGDRELFTGYRLGLMTNRRLRYCLDSVHPVGASHHQKIVVIDDALAFVGGIDFAARRWDTPRHELHDPRRVDTTGRQYPPFHDMQVAVDGEAAAALGEIARERWRRATGKKMTKVRRAGGDPWPESCRCRSERCRRRHRPHRCRHRRPGTGSGGGVAVRGGHRRGSRATSISKTSTSPPARSAKPCARAWSARPARRS